MTVLGSRLVVSGAKPDHAQTTTGTGGETAQVRPYQHDGTNWIVSRLQREEFRAVLLADDPGLGKTVQALTAAVTLDTQRNLVIAPAGARRVWFDEIHKWLTDQGFPVLMIEPGMPVRANISLLTATRIWVLVSYDVVSVRSSVWARALAHQQWDLLVLDEAHYLKSLSNRTIAIYGPKGTDAGIQANARHVILLTGTPTPNNAGELWHHCRTFWPELIRVPDHRPGAAKGALRDLSEFEFQERVTETRDTVYGRVVTHSKNQKWLRECLRPVVLHRSKARVLPELPPLQAQDVPLALARPLQEYLTPEAHQQARRLSEFARTANDADLVGALQRQQMRAHGEPGSPQASLRRQLGEAKVDAAVEWISEQMACGFRKMLVFGWHLSVLHHLHQRLAAFDPVLVTGETTPMGRANAVQLFQTRSTVRLFVGQMLATGTAITLTAATGVVIVEPSWVPGQNRQAIDRAHRLGQHDCVFAYFLHVPGTIDQRIMQTYRRKAEEIAPIYEDQP